MCTGDPLQLGQYILRVVNLIIFLKKKNYRLRVDCSVEKIFSYWLAMLEIVKVLSNKVERIFIESVIK